MTEKKPARRSAEREIMKQETIKSNIPSSEIPVNVSEEFGTCRHWSVISNMSPRIFGICVIKDEAKNLCRNLHAESFRYLCCRTYQSWLVKQNV